MNWSRWMRQIHRWLSVVFTVAILINSVAIAGKKYTNAMGLLAVFPLALLFLTGMYLFVLPYVGRWSKRRSSE